jgi:hypothetical protein
VAGGQRVYIIRKTETLRVAWITYGLLASVKTSTENQAYAYILKFHCSPLKLQSDFCQ